jgi:hypothetical protein
MKKNKFNKLSKMHRSQVLDMKRKKAADAVKGDGVYLFVNNTRGDLTLPKPPLKGPNPVPPGRTFEGDSYFMCLMKTNDVRLIQVIKAAEVKAVATLPALLNLTEKEENMPQKLILDQPETFTHQGKVEHTVPDGPNVKLNENQPSQKPADRLLTEDPLAGVEIILN